MKKRIAWSAALALAAAAVAPATAAPETAAKAPYVAAGKIAVGGDGGWDYLVADGASHRLFVTRGTHVQVIDLETGKLAGDIPGTEGVHGVALAPEFGVGFTSDGRANAVTVFDHATLAVTRRIAVEGRNPDAIVYDPTTKRVFTMNGRSGDATAIDAKTNAVVGTVALGGKPEFAVADGGKIFVNIEDKNAMVRFDAATLKVEATWPLAGCEEPSGLAIDRVGQRLFAVCGNKTMAVVDAKDGRVLATPPIGAGVDAAAFDPRTKLAFASNGAGTLTIVREERPGQFAVVADVPTQRGARTMALDETTHRVYLPTAEFGAPPAPTAERPHPRPPMVPGTFAILVLQPAK